MVDTPVADPDPASEKQLGWIWIERLHSAHLVVGAYPSTELADRAMQHSLLIDSFLQEDGTDCFLIAEDDIDGTAGGDAYEKVIVDISDPDHLPPPGSIEVHHTDNSITWE